MLGKDVVQQYNNAYNLQVLHIETLPPVNAYFIWRELKLVANQQIGQLQNDFEEGNRHQLGTCADLAQTSVDSLLTISPEAFQLIIQMTSQKSSQQAVSCSIVFDVTGQAHDQSGDQPAGNDCGQAVSPSSKSANDVLVKSVTFICDGTPTSNSFQSCCEIYMGGDLEGVHV